MIVRAFYEDEEEDPKFWKEYSPMRRLSDLSKVIWPKPIKKDNQWLS